MKKELVVLPLFVVFVSLPVFAQRHVAEEGKPVGQLLAQLTKSRGVQANVIAVDWADFAFLIPAAGNAPGANNTHFRSDVTIINHGDVTQRIAVGWMQAGTNNCSAATQIISIGTGWRAYEDFIGATLGRSGLGAVLFVAVDANGNVDEDAEIDGFSRIWTRQPNSTGTASQQFAPVSLDDLYSTLDAFAIGLRQDTAFRTNVGIVNLDAAVHTWDVEVWGSGRTTPTTFQMTVQPCALGQTSIPSGNFGPLLVAFAQRSPASEYWSAYGSSTDNITGDGWIVHASHGL